MTSICAITLIFVLIWCFVQFLLVYPLGNPRSVGLCINVEVIFVFDRWAFLARFLILKESLIFRGRSI